MENMSPTDMESVWKRVTESGEDNIDSESELKLLRKMIDVKSQGVLYYTALIRSLSPANQRKAMGLFSDEKSQLKKLQTMHLLLCGDTYAPCVKKPEKSHPLEIMRICYSHEEYSGKNLRASWEKTSNQRLSEMYSDMEQEDRAHMRRIEELIGELVG